MVNIIMRQPCVTLMKQHIHICEAHEPQLWTIENEGSESKEKAM